MSERLVVTSKIKAYIKTKSSMSTSDRVMDVLSRVVEKECDQAIEKAKAANRKTILDRDFEV